MTGRQLELLLDTIDQNYPDEEVSNDLLSFETTLWQAGQIHVAGVDEVGVGPLAGPLVAAAVVLPPWSCVDGVNDSKLLSPAARERLAEQIRKVASGIGIGECSVEEIDQLNVYGASITAMKKAVQNLPCNPHHLLVDARKIPMTGVSQTSLKKGDRRSLSIAAASIIAKTQRDQLMAELDRQFPKYGFAQHKGYPTKDHQTAIQKYGPSPIHRRSFSFIDELTGEFSKKFYSLRSAINAAPDQSSLFSVLKRYQYLKGVLSAPERRKLALLLRKKQKQLSLEA
jgi:ribonuclease HII